MLGKTEDGHIVFDAERFRHNVEILNEKLEMIKISDIKVPPGQRPINDKKVDGLIASIMAQGLLHPIRIDKEKNLILGRHRLEAFKKMGMERIPAIIYDKGKLDCKIARIDENLLGPDLSDLDRAELVYEEKNLLEEKYPELKERPKGGRPSKNRENNSGFTSATKWIATKMRVSDRTVQHLVSVAEKIPKDERKELRNTWVPNHQQTLYLLADQAGEKERKKLIKAIVEKKVKNYGEARDLVSKENLEKESPETDKAKLKRSLMTDAKNAFKAINSTMNGLKQIEEKEIFKEGEIKNLYGAVLNFTKFYEEMTHQ